MQHVSFTVWAVVAGIAAAFILVSAASGVVRRHLGRLAASLLAGAVTAFGVTAWVDGQRHKALAAAAHSARGNAVSVNVDLAAAFTVITLVVASIVFTVSALAARRRGGLASWDADYPQQGYYPRPRGRRYSSSRRGW
jgi:hypothetical protein